MSQYYSDPPHKLCRSLGFDRHHWTDIRVMKTCICSPSECNNQYVPTNYVCDSCFQISVTLALQLLITRFGDVAIKKYVFRSEKTNTEKTKPAVIAADSSSSSSSEEKVTTEKEAETTKKPKSKKKKKHSKKTEKKEEDEGRKRAKPTPEDGQRAGELFYESSRDENVNEQEEQIISSIPLYADE